MESPNALLGALGPWLRVLRATTTIGRPDPDPSKPVYVSMGTSWRIEPRAFEAIELLALLGEISYDAWKQALIQVWSLSGKMVIDASVDKAVPLGCAISANERLGEWFMPFVVPRTEGDGSRGYFELRGYFEAAYARREQEEQSSHPKPTPRGQLVVPVSVSMESAETALGQVMEIMSAQLAMSVASASAIPQSRPLLRVTHLMTSSHGERVITTNEMLHMSKIVECGGDIDRLSIFGVDTSDNVAVLLASGLQVIMGCEDQNEPAIGHTERGRVRAVETSLRLSRRSVVAVYSALAASQTVESVSLNIHHYSRDTLGSTERRHLWYWIAYAFFSEFATNQITDIRVAVDDLHAEDVAYVEEFLQHPRPLELLLHGEAGLKVPTSAAFATASRFYLPLPSSDPTVPRPHSHTFARQQVLVLPPISGDEDPVSQGFDTVLLPGYGRAWVKRTDIEERVSSRGLLARPLQSLVFGGPGITDESTPSVVKLLQLVGRQVTTLEFITSVDTSAPLDAWLLAVFEACPHLAKLTLHYGSLQSLDTIAEAFERRLTHLLELSIRGVNVVDARQAPALILKLADPKHPMTKSLRKVDIGYESSSSSSRVELWDAAHEVLRSNYKLRAFRLCASLNEQGHIGSEPALSFDEADQTPVHVQKQPLSFPAKVAFLSVVSRYEAQLQSMRAMDASVLAIVFQFAANCRTRSVVLRIS